MTTRVITTFIKTELDPSKHSAAYKIFHYEWCAAVPMMYVYTDDFMRTSGRVISDPDYDQRLPHQMVEGRYTIAQLAKLLDEGATIRLTVPEDAKAIYDIVLEHLENWSKKLRNESAFELNSAPTDELLLLSQLADHLLGFAKRYFTTDRPASSLMRRLEQLRGGLGLRNRRRWTDPNAEKKPEDQPKMREHGEFTQTILANGAGRNEWS